MKKSRLHTKLKNYEKQYISQVLRIFQANKIETAKYLGIDLSSLYRKIIELGIDKKRKKVSK